MSIMFEEAIANAAAVFVEIDGIWYAPAAALMELFAAYSSLVMGIAMIVIIGICLFVLLAYEPVSRLVIWLARRINQKISK